MFLFSFPSAIACSWPTEFLFSTWEESNSGDLVFSDTTLSGFPITVSVEGVISNWECYSTDYWTSDGYLVIK